MFCYIWRRSLGHFVSFGCVPVSVNNDDKLHTKIVNELWLRDENVNSRKVHSAG